MSDSEKDMMTIEAKFRVMGARSQGMPPQNFFSFSGHAGQLVIP